MIDHIRNQCLMCIKLYVLCTRGALKVTICLNDSEIPSELKMSTSHWLYEARFILATIRLACNKNLCLGDIKLDVMGCHIYMK